MLNRGRSRSGSTNSVYLDGTGVERRCLDSSFFPLSLLVDIHISIWKDVGVWTLAGRQKHWVEGSEPLVRPVAQGTSLGDIMELCRMDDVTLSISGEGRKGGEKSV